ncbi:MFS transporter [Shewanella ulleungensis]|uniref:MFS transporter n=1 Tax=Shewanella ulleungensis TaxID=2282699 RepID=A0ABQ2QW25_9GAMM|nr:MFS transporter [Shewanella ulleungensis]MCL1152078.1 MFS transporter [Shewanella ulleungensis]GGP99221.1 MFS transporter [Shewanella ulleungensis]
MILTKRFFPYFATLCLGALNDNFYKNVLLLLVTYSQLNALPIDVNLFVNLAAGVFILPFFLFSAHAGIVADNMNKAVLIKRLKLLELIIMSTAAIAIVSQSYMVMLVLLFLTGSQSAYFGPVKYSLLPQALSEAELVKGNALVEMGTFLSILIGTLSAGLVVSNENGLTWAAIIVCVLAVCGYLASRAIPSLPAQGKLNPYKFSLFSGTWRCINKARETTSIWMAILAISWFWFVGATYLTQFPNFAKLHLHADATVVSLLLALFSVGIAVGSFVCERFSFGHVELGLLPFGVLGLSIFSFDMIGAIPLQVVEPGFVYSFESFVANTQHYRVMIDLFLVGLSGGLFIVPLYAFIQTRAEKQECAQAIAANNIINALFMVGSAVLSIVLLGVFSWSIPELFTLIGVLNLVVLIYVYSQVPEFTQRFISYLLSHVMYRVKVQGRQYIPAQGAGIIVSNHVSYVDALIIMGASTRPIRFVMDKSISEIPLLKYVFKHAGVIPICSPKKCEATYLNAFEQIHNALANDELVCIFPEGRLTSDGDIGEFRPGIETILQRDPVPVIPLALNGLWGSYFSHKGGHALTTMPTRFWSRVKVNIAPVVAGDTTNRIALQQQVTQQFEHSIVEIQ